MRFRKNSQALTSMLFILCLFSFLIPQGLRAESTKLQSISQWLLLGPAKFPPILQESQKNNGENGGAILKFQHLKPQDVAPWLDRFLDMPRGESSQVEGNWVGRKRLADTKAIMRFLVVWESFFLPRSTYRVPRQVAAPFLSLDSDLANRGAPAEPAWHAARSDCPFFQQRRTPPSRRLHRARLPRMRYAIPVTHKR